MKPLRHIGGRERAVVEQRRQTGRRDGGLVRLAAYERTLEILLERLLPGVPETIDMVGFVDANTGRAMGRGDRRIGLPAEPELLVLGLAAIERAGFADMDEAAQLALIARMRHGDADVELGVPAKDFVDRLLEKSLAAYLSHPDAWERIGFTGPSFPEGYAWIGPAEAIARHRGARGSDRL